MGSGQFGIATFFAGDFARVASIKMVLTTAAFHDFTGFGDAHAFGERFMSLTLHIFS
ncbi:MAG: hypothetical protein UX09_C0046G0021 [Candidatus Uhrbacteria bacterium GW2011_GWE2_45_35]|uniref:Uncharacterized protein n=2 Tax=Candidatus Uhriibacteriota TaxID=1752732 RepID=A0A0G1JG07_9BACT|nr:MAG: hypothetical protein UW63_C0031G0013 [Candidatus Uhrbacteria bacterium GW2011_GWF2_44_350]KKU06659.1 MAG: hypothetical protein UX09_C0046G0021 [Candidatus Uhrbacteria bacterium GW2011_GWE2_45_35]